MTPGNSNNDTSNDEDLYLKKNRISSIETEVSEDSEVSELRPSTVPWKQIIIVSSIAGAVILAIVLITFIFKKPQLFTPSGNTEDLPIDTTEHVMTRESDNIRIKRGIESFQKGYITDAVAEFNEVVESDASDRDKAIALTYLGIISNKRGKYDEALEYYNRALSYDSKNPDIYSNMAMTYRHKKDFDKALDAAKESATLDGSDTGSKIQMGNIYYETGRYDDAIELYQDILKNSPENGAVLYNLATALLKKGDEFAAIEYLQKAGAADRIGEIAHKSYSRLGVIYSERKNFDLAEKYLKLAVSVRPEDPVNHYNLGIAYLSQKKNGQAIEEFQEAERLGENDAAMMEKIGEKYLDMGDYDRSLEVFSRLQKTNTRNVKILSRIGEIYYEKGELDRAYDAFQRITMIEPATESARVAYINIGNILDDAQRFDEAIDAYEKSLAISPKDDAALYNLGIAYKHAGKPELAISTWKKAADLNPNNARPLTAIADYYYERKFYDLAEKEYQTIIARWPNIQDPHFKMGTIYFKRGNYAYAIRAYDRVLEIDGNSELAGKALINKAILLARENDDEETLEQSVSLVQKALLISPGDPEALFSLGVIYSKKEMYDRAIDTFYQVIKGTRDSKLLGNSYNNIGKCYYKMKNYRKALQSFTRGIDEDPSNEEIRMNRKVAMQAYESELGKD